MIIIELMIFTKNLNFTTTEFSLLEKKYDEIKKLKKKKILN